MPFSDYKTALVTGASSGIGAAVVERLRREGLEVHALARSAEALAELAERTGCIAARDRRDRPRRRHPARAARSRSTCWSTTPASTGPKSFLKADAEDIDLLVDVNLRAVLHLCRLVVPGMVARDRGHVVNISSIAGAYNFGGNSHLPRHQGGGQHAVAPAAHRRLRQARARHRDLPGPGRDRHLRARARRLRGDPRALHRGLRAAAGRRTSPTRSPSPSPRRSPSTSATWRSRRRCRCRAACRPRGPKRRSA